MAEVRRVDAHGDGELFELVDAYNVLGRFPGTAKDRHQHRRQYGDDGDDNQQFDQCKTGSVIFLVHFFVNRNCPQYL